MRLGTEQTWFSKLFSFGPYNAGSFIGGPITWIRIAVDPEMKNTLPGSIGTFRTLYRNLTDSKDVVGNRGEAVFQNLLDIGLDTFVPYMVPKDTLTAGEDKILKGYSKLVDFGKKVYAQTRKLYKYQLKVADLEEKYSYHSGINNNLFNTSMKSQIETTNFANTKVNEEILLLKTILNHIPVRIFNYKDDNINSGEISMYNIPAQINNDTSYVQVGTKIDMNLLTSIPFTSQANFVDYQVMDYDTTHNFSNLYKYEILHKKEITKQLNSTNAAYKKLIDDYGFDIPFNPYRTAVATSNTNIGVIIPQPYFFGGDPSTTISDEWWNYYNIQKPKNEKAFDNKYLQFMSLSQFGKPTTTCASFCNLFDADEETDDSSFNNLKTSALAKCSNATRDENGYLKDNFDCYYCKDNTEQENLDDESIKEAISCLDLGRGLATGVMKGNKCGNSVISQNVL